MSKIERTFTKQTKDHGELETGSGQVWMDFEPANAATESLIERFLQEIGADYPTRGGCKKLVRVLSDVVMAARSAPTGLVIPPFLAGCIRRIHAAIFSFMAGVMPPMPMFGRSLL